MVGEGRHVRLDALLNVFSVGSGDWPWTEEYDNLIDQADTRKLLERIRVEGIREPILLGNDGRVWDGHHRIVIAMHLGLDSVPVEFSGSPVVPEEPEGVEQFTVGGDNWVLDMEFATPLAARDFIKRNSWVTGDDGAQLLHRVMPPWLPVEEE